MLDTDQLRSFLAIVDSGSFTRAAERVHKTQSAVSMHIRRLEEQLGCALFVKQGRGARLTDEGERLIEFARRIIQVEAGAMAALSRKGLQGRRPARDSRRLRRVVPGRNSVAVQSPPSSGRGLGRLRSVDRTRGAGCGRRARTGAGHAERIEPGAGGSTASSSCARSRWSGRPPSGSGSRTGRRSRSRSAAAPASGGAPRKTRSPPAPRATRGLVLLQEFHRDRIGRSRRARGDDPAGLDGRAEACASLGPDEGLPELPLTRMGLIHAPGRPTEEATALAEAIRGTIAAPARQAA